MSAECNLGELEDYLDQNFPAWSQFSGASYIGVCSNEREPSEEVLEHLDGRWNDLIVATAGKRAIQALIGVEAGLEVTWQAPYRRFDDSDIAKAEIGVISSPPSGTRIDPIIEAFAPQDLIEGSTCYYRYSERGAVKRFEQ